MTLDTVIWIIGIGFPVATLIFLSGWMVGFNSGANWSNCGWGTGYDDGWKAHKEFAEAIGGQMDAKRDDECTDCERDCTMCGARFEKED